jgi:diguanylate cyclase (GGDEF)-like protein
MSASGRIALKQGLDPELLKGLRPVWVPAGILLGTALVAWIVPLPASLAGLQTLGPSTLLAVAAALAWYFNRGRAFVVAATLLGAFAGAHAWQGPLIPAVLAMLVPLNVLAATLLPERGARYRASYAWFVLLAAEGFLLAWLRIPADQLPVITVMHVEPMHLAARIAFAAAFAAVAWRAWPDATPLQVGGAGALAAWFIAASWVQAPGTYAAFMVAAGAILIISMLQESHRLAFRDPLTGLPGRRALEERMRGLGSRFAIAMVDVDHFKKFNDTHGHDIGDQVLKLVGARLGEVGGGGIAYRYGGEEFSVLFPRAKLNDALPHLEALRASIEGYRMAVRSSDRPKLAEHGTKRRGEGSAEESLSVTVSIGACAPRKDVRTPAQVIKAADEALYRAKQGGRNRVST